MSSEVREFLNENGISLLKVKSDTLNIARKGAPVDTGNLRLNAINKFNRGSYKWRINYNYFLANYVIPLNEGWKSKQTGQVHDKHKGFIGKTNEEITIYILSVFEKNDKFKNRSRAYANDISSQASLVNRRSKILLKELETQRENRKLRSIRRAFDEFDREF